MSQDLPPYTMSFGVNKLCGLNIVGLRRAGFTTEQRRELNFHYKRIFVEGNNVRATVTEALASQPGNKAREMLEFIATSTRGVCAHASRKH